MSAKPHIRKLDVPKSSSEDGLNPLTPSSYYFISTSLFLWQLPCHVLLAEESHLALKSPAVFSSLQWAFLILALPHLRLTDLYQRSWHGSGTSHLLQRLRLATLTALGLCTFWLGSKFNWESQNRHYVVLTFETDLKHKGFCISRSYFCDYGISF